MKESGLIELEQRELTALGEFLDTLTAERKAIMNFSLEDVIRENNRKEEIIRRLELIEVEKKRFLEFGTGGWDTEDEDSILIHEDIENKVREVRTALERNMGLLSFSMDHVKTSLEKIIDFVNKGSYEKGRGVSVLVSRKV
jgi:hypothetical protein